MYDQIFADLNTRMQPIIELAENNRKTMETLANLQKESMTDVISTSLEQIRELVQCKDPKAVLDQQVKFFKALEANMTETTEKSVAAINEAKDAFVAVVEDSVKKTSEEVEVAVQKVTGQQAA